MLLLVIAVINSIAALFAHEFACRRGRNANFWTFVTALFAPALAVVLLMPEKSDTDAEVAQLPGNA